MKYLNVSFTMPTCEKRISDLEYNLRVGLISQEEYDKLTMKSLVEQSTNNQTVTS